MKQDELAKSIKQIIEKHLNINLNQYSDGGDNLFITKDLHINLIDQFEILNKIEKKHNILINDENIMWNNDLTIKEYITEIFKQLKHK